ncbi:MAG: hypothetical protein BWZ02_00893 [Lentisphaerae bacterium ADurb.BinA184]|nr:MAG: hypothetical protein BWZ02_00893 [Lentisphaerae bacterium ADurb.BinA184]
MIVVEHAGIELDYCVACNGVWFDATELDLLFDRSGLINPAAPVPGRRPGERDEATRHCPLCDVDMEKALIGQEPPVLIDRCPAGHGLWFDGGEAAQLIRQAQAATPDPSGRIIEFLGETLTPPQPPEGGTVTR